jgi:translation initiation factor 3 subunit M
MYINIYDTLKSGELSIQAYEFILLYLASFTKDQVNDQAKEYGQVALKDAISIPEVLNFEDLFLTAPVQALSELPLFNLAKVFLDQDLAQYISFVDSNANLAQELSLNKENDLHKLRLLTLTNLGTERLSVPIPYSEVAAKLQIEASEVEMWVIDVIRYGLIEAKINQHDETVIISRATHRSFTKDNWENLDQALTNWKDSLHQVIQILKTSSNQFQQQAAAIKESPASTATKSSQ